MAKMDLSTCKSYKTQENAEKAILATLEKFGLNGKRGVQYTILANGDRFSGMVLVGHADAQLGFSIASNGFHVVVY
jgi:hypothetical protein